MCSTPSGGDRTGAGGNMAGGAPLRAEAGLRVYRTYQMKVTECDKQIEQTLAKLPDRSAGANLRI